MPDVPQGIHPAGCLMGIIALLYGVLLIAVSTAASDQSFARELENSLHVRNTVRFGDGLVYRVVALLSLILAATITANDYHWRTIVMRVGWTGEKVRPFLASLIVVSIICAIGLVLGYATIIFSVLVVGAVHGSLAPEDVGAWLLVDSGLAIIRTMPAVFVFIAGAAVVAALTKSTAAGIAIPIGVLFLEPIGAAVMSSSSAMDTLVPMMLSRNVDSLLAANGTVLGGSEELPSGLPSAWLAACFLLVYGGLTVALGARLAARREVPD